MQSREYYESLWEGLPEGARPLLAEARLEFLLDHLAGGERVLDVGCGEGFFTQAMADAAFEVIGLEVAEEPLRRARRRRPGLDLRLLVADGRWPLADAEIDVVWAGEVIEHVADTAAWLSEARRVLRPRGLLLSTPSHDWLLRIALALSQRAFERHFDPRGDHLRFYTRRSLRTLLEDFRFEDVRIVGAGGVRGARAALLASGRRARF